MSSLENFWIAQIMLMTFTFFACEVKKTLVHLTVKLMLKIIEVGEAGASCHMGKFCGYLFALAVVSCWFQTPSTPLKLQSFCLFSLQTEIPILAYFL